MLQSPNLSPHTSLDQADPVARLKDRIVSHKARIGVVGLGYVGLPFAVEKAKVGFEVIGIEQNSDRVEQVNRATSYIGDISDLELSQVVDTGKLRAISSFEEVSDLDVIVICVPTPLTKNLTPDLSYVQSVTQAIGRQLKPGQLVSLESTTYPGTTDEVMRSILEQCSGLKQGEGFFLAHSPERVDPGNQRYTTQNTNKVVGASDPLSLELSVLFYEQTIKTVVPVSSAKTAELVKVFENTFRAVNIALVNELALLCDRLDINIWEVLDAANTKPFGIMPFYPGPGVGGHCIPIDPHYLEWKAKEVDFSTRFIALAGEINRRMPSFVRSKAFRVLNRQGIAPSKAHILVMGVTYKKDLADWRESPALEVIKSLLKEGTSVTYHDPFTPELEIGNIILKSVSLTDDAIAQANLVIIATDHSSVDYARLINHSRSVLDTRGITRHLSCDLSKVTLL
jgi:UDP-N-acetyl-D-glucosamine dehydrogenase